MLKRTKITKQFRLSIHNISSHIVNGMTLKQYRDVNPDDYAHMSFAESMSPLHAMIEAFEDLPTGIKIRVTMEVVDD